MSKMEKKAMRKYMREVKRKYTPEEKRRMSLPVWVQLEQDENFKKARIVLGYWSMEDEVCTHEFIMKWAEEKTFLLPCVKGDELELRYYDGAEKLCPGEAFAIPEPVGDLFTELEKIDFIIVPGMAFDLEGNRLGRGKGYYDRILKSCGGAYKVGICFPFQLVEKVPTEECDVAMDKVIA